VSHEKIFTQFPGSGGRPYYMLDINAIESICQTDQREIAVIITERMSYRCEIEPEALDEGNFPDAAQYCYQILANAAIAAAGDPNEPSVPIIPERDDYEDDPFGK